jgi:hypothetical protein
MSEYEVALGGAPGSHDALASPPGGGEMLGAPDANGLIVHPRDADVLCGRGGAALRHPGNQTYRRLVNLNKGLYITCLKTEKLKISRSIVAAIREQNGRFLEKSADQNAWYDIGDKKAVEKTSQALREGQPKLRQKIIEMGVAVNPNDSPGGADGNDKVDMVVGGANVYGEAPYGSGTIQAQQNMLQQQMLQQGNMMQQQSNTDLSQQQLMPPHQLAPLTMSSSSINNTQDLHAELLRRLSLHDLQQNISSASFQQQPLQSMSTNSMQQQQQPPNSFQPTSVEQQLLQQQQLLYNQQQQSRSSTPQQQRPLNTRASFARELGISESQLSIMSDFSGYGGGSMSGFGSGPLNASGHSMLGSTTTSMSDMQALMNIDSSFRNALMGMPLGSMNTAGGDPSVMDNTMNSMNHVASNQAQMYINNQMQQQQYQQQQPQQQFYQQQFQQPNSYAPMAQQVTGAMMPQQPTTQQMPQLTNSGPTTGAVSGSMSGGSAAAMPSNFDRRRVFAKMKYTRPPSVQSVSGGTGTSQINLPSSGDIGNDGPQRQPIQQQQSGTTLHTTATTEEMNNFHLVDSNGMESAMSLVSTMSNAPLQVPSGINSSSAAQGGPPSNNITTGNIGNNASYDQRFAHKQQPLLQPPQHYSSNFSNFPSMKQPSHLTTYDTGFSKVVVETAKVIDHSSGGGRTNSSSMFNDAMSIGSRNSLMSGLSRISDTSYDNSIFSDLSKKIGNVSTRSMAMSEMSALEIQELNEDDDNNDVGGEAGDVDDDSAPCDIDNYEGEAATNI